MSTLKTHQTEEQLKLAQTLKFEHLPEFARFILQNKLEEYTREQIKFSFEENVPLLKFLKHLSEEELVELGIASNREFLTALAENRASAFIDKSTADYIKNRIDIIERDEVVAEDITIITFIRRKTLRRFLKYYKDDLEAFVDIMEEVDRFVAESEVSAFNAFIKIQKEKTDGIYKELDQRKEELFEAQDLAGMGSFLWNMKADNSVYSPGVMKIFGMNEATNLVDFMEFVHEDDRQKLGAAIARALKEDGLYDCEYRYVRDGIEKRIWSRGRVHFENGEAVNMKGTIMDVTDRHNLLTQLQESEEANKQAQFIAHLGNWAWDIEDNMISWSDEMYRIYGLQPQSEDITFERFTSFVHPDDRERRIFDIQESLLTLKVNDYVMRIITPEGVVKVLRGKGEVLVNKHSKPVKLVGTCQDITWEYALNAELGEKEAYLKQLINNAPDAIIVADDNGIINLWNPKMVEIFGWKQEEVIGQQLTELIIPVKYKNKHKEGLLRLLKTSNVGMLERNLELTALNRAGEEFAVSLTVSRSVMAGKPSFIAFIRDISEEKQTRIELQYKTAQLEKLNSALELKNYDLERMNKELESFNYIASHDLQEPLRKIQTFTERIVEKGRNEFTPATLEYFNKIMVSSARMKLLIEDLLMFSQTTGNENNFEQVDLELVLEEVKNILSASIDEKQAVIESMALPTIRAIPFQIQQLFLNLISNAIKYSGENAKPHIQIRSEVVDSSVIPVPSLTGKYIEISFKDNGIGFEEEHAEKIFGLFQRLHHKDQYSGTGIGLAICKKIMQNHHGFIYAHSTLGKGSVFTTYFPYKPEERQLLN